MAEAVAGIARLRPDHGPLLIVVGIFDGLHRGHQYLIRELRHAARTLGARPAVLTFDHHPDEILAGAAPPVLCDPDERLVRLGRAGVAVTIVEHFDAVLRETPFDVFVERIRARTALAGFLMTPDAAFGYRRGGTPESLAALGERDGFQVVVVPPYDLDGRPVRSTDVRAAIAAGDLDLARSLLGRRVAVTGDVDDHGRASPGVPRRLRFPLPVAAPPPGRYVATVEPAWTAPHRSAGQPAGPGGRERRAIVSVEDDGLAVTSRGLPDGDRVRVAFVGRAAED